jgi:ribosomal protein S6
VRNYEVVFVAVPTLTSEELDGFIDHIQTVIEGKNGKVVKVDNWKATMWCCPLRGMAPRSPN